MLETFVIIAIIIYLIFVLLWYYFFANTNNFISGVFFGFVVLLIVIIGMVLTAVRVSTTSGCLTEVKCCGGDPGHGISCTDVYYDIEKDKCVGTQYFPLKGHPEWEPYEGNISECIRFKGD